MKEAQEKRTKKPKEADQVAGQPMLALRDFLIVHNEHRIEIKAGQDVSSVPAMFHENLRTELVIE